MSVSVITIIIHYSIKLTIVLFAALNVLASLHQYSLQNLQVTFLFILIKVQSFHTHPGNLKLMGVVIENLELSLYCLFCPGKLGFRPGISPSTVKL